MATSLSKQLKKLAAPQTSLLDHQKKKASIIFKSSEAANHSRETFYQIGVSGFSELVEVNDQFSNYKENLFGLKMKDFQRVVQTEDVNKQLDEVIEEFLLLLSPYLQKQSALKALEWLLNRFLINEMNVTALMMCIFPYYETILFIRVLQLINIQSEQSPWNWLYNSQDKGRPIPKQTIFMRWSSDQWFRNFISKYFRKMLKIHKNEDNLRLAASLLISTQIGGLESAEKVTENHISSVCQTLQLCFVSNKREIISGALLTICQLSISVALSYNLLEEILSNLVKISDQAMQENVALCLLTLFYHQNLCEIPSSVFENLEQNETLIAQVLKFSNSKPVSSIMTPFIKQSVIMNLSSPKLSDSKKKKRLQELVQLIEITPLAPAESCNMIRAFIQGISQSKMHLMALQKLINVGEIFNKFERNHPEGLDKACAKILKDSKTSDCNTAIFERKIIDTFWNKCLLQLKIPFIKKSKKEAIVLTPQEQWEGCYGNGKLSPSSVKFLEKTLAGVCLPEKKRSFPFWQLSGTSEMSSALREMVKVLKVVILKQIHKKSDMLCDQLLKQIFNVKLANTKERIYFLSMIFGWNEDDEDVGINKYMKLWALNLTYALLSRDPNSGTFSWMLDAQEPLFASLVTPLCEGDALAAAAFRVLDAMKAITGGRLRPCSLSVIVDAIVANKEEISADVSYLPSTVLSLIRDRKGLGRNMVDSMFACVLDPAVPTHIKSSILYLLSQVEYPDLFSRLIPMGNGLLDQIKNLPAGQSLSGSSSTCLYYILLRFTPANLGVLEKNDAWQLFRRSLDFSSPVLRVSGQELSPQELVANYKLLQGISDSNHQIEVLEAFLSRIIRSNNCTQASKLNKELKKISLDASQIISLWGSYNLVPRIKSVKEARAKKMKEQNDQKSESNIDDWRKFGLLIELIGVMPNLGSPWLIIGPICEHIRALVKLESSFADTLQQQMLSVCYHLLKMCSERLNKEEFIKNCKLNVALIVQSIRTSVNPDTHRRALLILAMASNYFPDQVLHNIMAIFTFMGTSLLRRDDSYSFHVIHLTISSIVPTLVQVESSDPNLLLKKLSQVTQVFVDALPDLPEHRRLPLFKQLATTLGVSQYLWLVMVLIADAYVTNGPDVETDAGDDDPRRLPRNIHFALVLYRQFCVTDQLKASCELMEFVSSLPEDKDFPKGSKDQKGGGSSATLVVNIEAKTWRHLRQLRYTCLGLLVHLMCSENFIGQVYEFYNVSSDGDLDELKSLYKVLLEKSLQYLKVVSAQEELQRGNPSGRFWQAMQRKLLGLVDAVNSLLPPALLVEVLSNLLRSNSDLIRCRAMEILASKLQPDVKFFRDEEVKPLVEFIDPLRNVGMDVNEPENNRQTAFFTLHLLVRRLNSLINPEVILPVLESSAMLLKRGDLSTKVTTQAALVVAETVNVLKIHSLVHLDKLVPALIAVLENSLKDETPHSDNLVIATAAAVNKVVENLPRLIPKDDLQSLLIISCQLISKQEDEGVKESRLTSRLTSTLDQIAHHVELRLLIPSLTEIYNRMSKKGLSCLPSLMSITESLIDFVKSSSLVNFKQDFISLFIAALDVRNTRSDVDVDAVERVEGCVISALTRFLLRLNEDENDTLFSLLLHWAWDYVEQKPLRLITFFRFADQLAGSLKVLFIKARLAFMIFDYAVQVLERNNNLLNEDTVFGNGDEAEERTCILLNYVLAILTKIFLYDSVQFTDRDRFNIIVEPLINQIENTIGNEDQYNTRISNYLKTCIIAFTKAIGDDCLWKELNRQILLRIRSDNDTKVILAGLEIFEGLVESLGEDYLQPLLADTIPYITEILESFDPDVENKAKDVFNKMEQILGDSLRAYLET